VLEDEDVVVRHDSFAGLGQGQNHSPLVVAVVVAAIVVAAVVVVVAVDIHEQRNGLRHDCKFLGGRMLHWHSSGVQVYFEESLD
jgi:hypothetical protein